MIRRALILALGCVAGACGFDAIPSPGADTVGADAAPPDGEMPDASPDGPSTVDATLPALPDAASSPPVEAAPPPDAGENCVIAEPYRTLFAEEGGTNRVQLQGVTSDGYAIYAVENTPPVEGGATTWSVNAAKLDGSEAPREVVGTYTPGAIEVSPVSPTVLLWDDCTTGGSCQLRLWSSSLTGTVPAVQSASCWGAASDDGTSVMYVGNLNSNDTLGDLIGVSSDGGGAATLAANVALGPGSTPCGVRGILEETCAPNFAFVGPDAGKRAIAAYCQPMTENASIVSFPYPFDGGTGDAGVLLTPHGANPNWSTDSSGLQLFVTNKTGTPLLINSATGAVTSFVGNGAGNPEFGESTSGLVTPSGAHVFFVAATKGEAPCGDAAGLSGLWSGGPDGGVDPVPLACGVDDILSTSPDGKIAYFDTRTGAEGGTNLYSADRAGGVVPITTASTMLLLGFTTDESRLVWIASATHQGSAPVSTGILVSYVTASRTPTAVASNVATNVAMAARSNAVYLANLEVVSMTPFTDARGDLFSVDLASTKAPTPLATGVFYRFAMDPAGTKVAVACNAARGAGVYVKDLP